jgi:large subunit ribosomal protein L19
MAIGDVNRAKLYYLRGRVGKKARIREIRQDSPKQKAAKEAAAALKKTENAPAATEPADLEQIENEPVETAAAVDEGTAPVDTPDENAPRAEKAEVGAES